MADAMVRDPLLCCRQPLYRLPGRIERDQLREVLEVVGYEAWKSSRIERKAGQGKARGCIPYKEYGSYTENFSIA